MARDTNVIKQRLVSGMIGKTLIRKYLEKFHLLNTKLENI